MSKYKRTLDEAFNLPSTKRGFRNSNHMLATLHKSKQRKDLFIFNQRDKFTMMDFI